MPQFFNFEGFIILDIYKYIPKLVPMYNEPHRHYHSLQHIHNLIRMIKNCSYMDMMNEENKNKIVIVRTNIEQQLSFIAWFHDCYYDPYLGSPENEYISRRIFTSMINDDLQQEYLPEVELYIEISRGIENTAKHLEDVSYNMGFEPESIVNLLFMDLDLWGFSDASEFKRTSPLIRAEYYKTDDVTYLQGRIQFLKALLEKPRIYYTFKEELEQSARTNIQAGIIQAKIELNFLYDKLDIKNVDQS